MKVFFFTEGTVVSPASRIRVYEYLARYRGDGPFQARTVSYTSGTYCRRIVAGVRAGLGLKPITDQGRVESRQGRLPQ